MRWGGGERLVANAAVGLQSKGHTVVMYTSHHDASHAFVETTDGTLTVKVYGDFLPRTIFGRGHILCATLRGVYLALVLALMEPQFDLFLVDQLSAPNPILFLTGAKILFYCHFPDLKLSGARSWLKALYRGPFDWLEEWTTLLAHRILVNSHFTAKVFQETFKSAHSAPAVLYPCINLEAFDKSAQDAASQGDVDADLASALETRTCFVSINRFERKKDVGLALRAFGNLRVCFRALREANLRQILAGGYDPRVRENREYRLELDALATELGVSAQVIFKQSFSDAERGALLGKAVAVVYTPVNEHFGIVPIEAMYSRRPVIACNSGGPTESILDGVTGFLCEPGLHALDPTPSTLTPQPLTSEPQTPAPQTPEPRTPLAPKPATLNPKP
ncbi:alpha-1,3-mannosyltransferase ALG2-like protein [Baffinella frigidus]|nr:alpha-1,3-mannosyltransferase ALG2-like protein [Cryptophyta sp. CCMP2293]